MISNTKDSLAADAKRAGNEAWDKTADARDSLEDAAHNAGRKVRGYLDTATGEFTHAADSVKTHIRGNPMQSSLVALAAGFVLGRLFRL
jgi:ElaB/YqjD/DUF883 family membrane-anchored ribosome-binding protein